MLGITRTNASALRRSDVAALEQINLKQSDPWVLMEIEYPVTAFHSRHHHTMESYTKRLFLQ